MFLVRLLRTILSWPVTWLGHLFMMFKQPLCAGLLAKAYEIGGNPNTAAIALASASHFQPVAQAVSLASRWMRTNPHATVAAFGGLLALQAGDEHSARDFFQTAKKMGTEPTGTIDQLEICLTQLDRTGRESLELAERMERRNDLPPLAAVWSKRVRMFDALRRGDIKRAWQYAKFMTSINDDPEAELVMWAYYMQRGDQTGADIHLAGAASLPADQRLHYQAVACKAIGQNDLARQYAEQLREYNPSAADELLQYLAGQGDLS